MKNTRIDALFRTDARYQIRVLGTMAGVLVVLTLMFRFWPVPDAGPPGPQIYDTRGRDVVTLDLIQPTSQVSKPPPPPAPLPPIAVPDDVDLEEEFDIQDEISTDVGEEITEAVDGPVNTGPVLIAQADVSPKPVRFVEPEYSKEARQRKIKAQVMVEVLVDEKGRVMATKIIDRFLLGNKDEPPTPVSVLGYGLEEAALAAAERWRFRPGRHNGRAVQTYTTLTFSFGV